MEIWPGKPYPLGATYDGTGANFALFSEVAERVELCLIDDARHGDPRRPARGRRLRLARLPARRAAGPALRLPGARPVRPGRRATAATRPSCCSTPTPRRSTAQIDGDESLFSYRLRRPERRRRRHRNTEDSLGNTMLSVVINPFFDWGHDRPPQHEYHETVIYEAHVKGLTMPHPDVPEEIRGTYAGIAHPAIIEHLTDARRHRHRADAGAPVRPGPHAARPGPVELLGLQHDRLLRPAQRLRGVRHPRRAGHRVQGDGQGAARGRHRGHPRRGLQPHRRGQPPGPDAGVPRHRQRRLLPAGRRRPGALLRHHRHRQQPADAAPARAAADHGLAALLGHRDARRRVPVRPRGHPGPPVPRGRPAVGVLRPRPAGPGHLARSS